MSSWSKTLEESIMIQFLELNQACLLHSFLGFWINCLLMKNQVTSQDEMDLSEIDEENDIGMEMSFSDDEMFL